MKIGVHDGYPHKPLESEKGLMVASWYNRPPYEP